MADPHATPDPMDQAYLEAEAILGDEAERAARRDRALAAVANESRVAASPPPRPVRWNSARTGRWLAAAGVVGLAVFFGVRLPQWSANERSAEPKPTAPVAVVSKLPSSTSPAAPQPLQAAAKARATPTASVTPTSSTPAVSPTAPAPNAPAPPPAPSAKASADVAGESQSIAQGRQESATEDLSFADPREAEATARLREAAAAGRSGEVAELLANGTPVDAPDADGETALMRAIEADRPAIVRLLRRHGASPEITDHAGKSARDMAAAAGDSALRQALQGTP